MKLVMCLFTPKISLVINCAYDGLPSLVDLSGWLHIDMVYLLADSIDWTQSRVTVRQYH